MGIFDFLRKSTPTGSPAPSSRKVSGPAKVVADKRAQTYDRIEAIQELTELRSFEAAAALLKRFSFAIDPSITDQEEKDLAFQGVIGAGAAAVPAVLEYCTKADVLTWPIKILEELLDAASYETELVTLLARFDTEYTRNVEPKIQIIHALEEVRSEQVRTAVERFLEDVNETVRFCAVQTTFSQNDSASAPAFVGLLAAEESVRIKNKVAEGLKSRGWALPVELRERATAALRDSDGYFVDANGKVEKR